MNRTVALSFGLILLLTCFSSNEAFFMRWGSDNSQTTAQKQWIPAPQQLSMPQPYRTTYSYPAYDQRKIYQGMSPVYQQSESIASHMQPIPISVPLQASLTPVSLQHVQLVPCMCPVAPEEAEKLQESMGSGPYIAQAYSPTQNQAYSPAPQQLTVQSSDQKSLNKQ